jgi:hypothetical protein
VPHARGVSVKMLIGQSLLSAGRQRPVLMV